jgi:hypothetical protein
MRDLKHTTGNDSGISPRAKALMVLIAVITLIAIWLVPGEKEEAPPALPEMASAPPVDQFVPLPLPPAGEDAGMAPRREGEKARTIVSELRAEDGEPEPGEVFARAERLQSEGHFEDAYLLYRLAARHGHAQAAMVLATQADPAFYTAETSILPGPDPHQAYKWYRAAAAAGDGEAEQRLQQLREHVEQSAADGDAAARRLLLQWR